MMLSNNVDKIEANDTYSEVADEPKLHQLPPRSLKAFRWRTWKNYFTFAILLLLVGACLAAIVLSAWVITGTLSSIAPYLCYDDGSFAISMSFGSLDLRAVKIIDAAVNTLLGRGVQILCGWIAYRIAGMATLRIMQENKVSLAYLHSNAFQRHSLEAGWSQCELLFGLQSWRARITVTWLAMSIVFLILTPTMIDLTTGYVSAQSTGFNLSPNLISSDVVELQEKDLAILSDLYLGKVWPDWSCFDLPSLDDVNTTTTSCPTSITVGDHTFKFDDLVESENNRYRWKLYDRKKSPQNPIRCTPEDTYGYGFSWGYLLLYSMSLILWLCGTFGVWIDTIRYGYLWKMGRGWGPWRAILDLGDHLRANLGEDHGSYSEAELEDHISRMPFVGDEIQTDGQYACLKLSSNPGGHEFIHAPEVLFGGEARLDQRRATNSWPDRTD